MHHGMRVGHRPLGEISPCSLLTPCGSQLKLQVSSPTEPSLRLLKCLLKENKTNKQEPPETNQRLPIQQL